MLLFVNDADHCLAAREATLRERLLVRLRWNRLDRLLATGASPEGSALLALRAQQLVRPEVRQELGRTVKDMIRDAREPAAALSAGRTCSPARRPALRRGTGGTREPVACPCPSFGHGHGSRFSAHHGCDWPAVLPLFTEPLDVILQEAVLALDPMRTW